MRITRRSSRSSLAWLIVGLFAIGCADSGRDGVDLAVPDLSPSRAALAASLDAWKAGRRASGVLIGSKPSVGVVDSTRTERPLLDYEVVGPLMPVEKARPFAVRLVLGSPRETVDARYLVLGQDPLWVFRQDDFELMLHWEHKMDGGASPNPDPTGPSDARN